MIVSVFSAPPCEIFLGAEHLPAVMQVVYPERQHVSP